MNESYLQYLVKLHTKLEFTQHDDRARFSAVHFLRYLGVYTRCSFLCAPYWSERFQKLRYCNATCVRRLYHLRRSRTWSLSWRSCA